MKQLVSHYLAKLWGFVSLFTFDTDVSRQTQPMFQIWIFFFSLFSILLGSPWFDICIESFETSVQYLFHIG